MAKVSRKKAPVDVDLKIYKSGGKTVVVSRKGNLFKLKWLP